jgi:hypothetical protein
MGIFDGIRAAGTDASRQKGLYYAIEADKSATEAAAKQRALTKAKLGGITNGLVEIAQEVSEREGIPYAQALKKAASDPKSGYAKLLNGFMKINPNVHKNLISNTNRDMSQFADNPIAGTTYITDFSGFDNADELTAQYPNGAYQVNLRKKANTMTQDVMNGLASVLPESMEELVPWTRNASSDPNDAMELISYEDMVGEIQQQQRLYGNTSPYIATKMAELSNPDGKNPYAPPALTTAWRAAVANSGTYNDQVQKMDARNNVDPIKNFADKTFAYNQAIATAKPKDTNAKVLEAYARTFTPPPAYTKGALVRFTSEGISKIDKILANPALKEDARALLGLQRDELLRSEEAGVAQYLSGIFGTSWYEFYDKTKGETGFWDTAAAVFDGYKSNNPNAGRLASQLLIDGGEVSAINAHGEKGDPVSLARIKNPDVRAWVEKNALRLQVAPTEKPQSTQEEEKPTETKLRLEALQRQKALLEKQKRKAKALKQQEKQDVVSHLKKVTEQQLAKAKK